MEIIKAFGWLVLGLISGTMIVVFLWFVIGMSINFYKIYIKKYKISPKNCEHDRVYFKESWFGESLKCNDCGKKF